MTPPDPGAVAREIARRHQVSDRCSCERVERGTGLPHCTLEEDIAAALAQRENTSRELAKTVALAYEDHVSLRARVAALEKALRNAWAVIRFHPECPDCDQARDIADNSDARCQPHNDEFNRLWESCYLPPAVPGEET